MNEKLKLAIIAFREGDINAFTEIYNLQYNHVYYIALQHSKNEQEAQDIAQESFIEIYRSLDSLKEVDHFNAWINRIVYSFFIKSIRSKQVSERIHLNETTNLEEIIPSSELSNPSELYISDELLGAVEVSFQSLSASLQEVARMRFYDEMTIPEISSVLNVPQGTVKSRINTLRGILQENLKDEYRQIRVALAPVLYLYFSNVIEATRAVDSSLGAGEIIAASTLVKIKTPGRKRYIKPSNFLIGATIVAAPIIISNDLDQTLPKIETVTYSKEWTKDVIPATIQYNFDDPNNNRVHIELNGEALFLGVEGDFNIHENGYLTISFKDTILYSDHITSIDRDEPDLELVEDGAKIKIKFNDELSGVDFSTIKVFMQNGSPVSFSLIDNQVVLQKESNETFTIVGNDYAGNSFEYQIKSVEDMY